MWIPCSFYQFIANSFHWSVYWFLRHFGTSLNASLASILETRTIHQYYEKKNRRRFGQAKVENRPFSMNRRCHLIFLRQVKKKMSMTKRPADEVSATCHRFGRIERAVMRQEAGPPMLTYVIVNSCRNNMKKRTPMVILPLQYTCDLPNAFETSKCRKLILLMSYLGGKKLWI